MKTELDYCAVLDNMKPAQRFWFGLEYLFYTVKAKITNTDADLDFLEDSYQKQMVKEQANNEELVGEIIVQPTKDLL